MKVLTDIPGFERKKLHCINCSDDLSKVLFAGKLIAELRGKYCTSVAYFSTRGTAKDIENIQGDYTDLIGTLYAIDLENNDCIELCDRAAEMVEKKFVRAIVIDCIEGLDVKDFEGGTRAKRNEIKTNLYFLAATSNIRVLLFCPYRKYRKYDNEYDPFLAEILPQMRART